MAHASPPRPELALARRPPGQAPGCALAHRTPTPARPCAKRRCFCQSPISGIHPLKNLDIIAFPLPAACASNSGRLGASVDSNPSRMDDRISKERIVFGERRSEGKLEKQAGQGSDAVGGVGRAPQKKRRGSVSTAPLAQEHEFRDFPCRVRDGHRVAARQQASRSPRQRRTRGRANLAQGCGSVARWARGESDRIRRESWKS